MNICFDCGKNENINEFGRCGGCMTGCNYYDECAGYYPTLFKGTRTGICMKCINKGKSNIKMSNEYYISESLMWNCPNVGSVD